MHGPSYVQVLQHLPRFEVAMGKKPKDKKGDDIQSMVLWLHHRQQCDPISAYKAAAS